MIDDRQGTPMTAAARPHRHRPLLAYAVVPVALAVLGACTASDPGPAVTTTSSSSAVTSSPAPTAITTSTAPSPTATVDPVIAKIPAAARANDKPGGVAFSRFYFDTLNSAFKTGDSELLAALASPRCPTCMAFVSGVEQLNDQERRYGGDLVSVASASALNFSDKNRQVLLEIDQKSVPVLNK